MQIRRLPERVQDATVARIAEKERLLRLLSLLGTLPKADDCAHLPDKTGVTATALPRRSRYRAFATLAVTVAILVGPGVPQADRSGTHVIDRASAKGRQIPKIKISARRSRTQRTF